MRPRNYIPGSRDAKSLDKLLDSNKAGDVRLESDRVIVAVHGPDDPVVGTLVWRPAGFVHELVVAKDLPKGLGVARRLAAHSMAFYAIGEARARPYDIRQAIFLVDSANESMLRFVREVGAVEQSGTIFTLDI